MTDVYVFGGVCAGSAGEVSGELFALDTMSMTWRELEPAGVPPVPRAGAAGAVVGEAWFVAGGGGAGGGRRDTVALRVEPSSGELEWTSAAEVGAGSSLAAEGAGVVAVGGAALLASRLRRRQVLRRRACAEAAAAGRLPMTKTKMLSPVKRKEWVSAAETEARRGSSRPARRPREPARREPARREPRRRRTRVAQTRPPRRALRAAPPRRWRRRGACWPKSARGRPAWRRAWRRPGCSSTG